MRHILLLDNFLNRGSFDDEAYGKLLKFMLLTLSTEEKVKDERKDESTSL